jgi:hypothetical protein
MTLAGTIAYKFIAHATYLHVYTLTGMPVSATQVDSTTFDLLACNLKEGTRGHETGMCLENIGIPSSYPFPTLSGVGTTCFSSCYDKDSAIIFTTGRLSNVNPP